jgi:hypothetical protein
MFRTIPLAGLLLLATVSMAAPSDVVEVELRLTGALRPPAPTTQPGPSLVLDLTRTGERWERVWGVESDSRHATLHAGRVRQATVAADRVALDIAMEGPSPWRVQIEAAQAPGGALRGRYTVTMPDRANTGEAEVRIKPSRPPLPKDFVPPKPGEHPRILFRAADLPRLRETAGTPLGRALMARMGDEASVDAIGAGIKWQITRDQAMAELSRKLTELQIAGKGPGYSARMSKGRVPEQVALALDLCYDAWPQEFRQKVIEFLVTTARTYMGRMSGNEHVCSNWNARVHAGAGFAMLALWGEKGAMPPKPQNELLVPFWEDDVADWKRLGEVNMDYERLFERTRYLLYLFCREATGTGGFRGENAHYGLLAAEMSIEYAACHRQMFGSDVSPYNDITWMVPRMIFGHYFPEGGKPVALDINGKNYIDNEFFAYSYRLAPEKWRGALLWAWNRHLGASGPDELARQIAAQSGKDASGGASWMLLHYPPSAEPQHPAKTMPLTWEAPDHGYYGFRNSWAGKGDFVLQAHAKAHVTGGWNSPNAGAFRLFGLGQSWNDTSSARDANVWEEGRVMVDDPVNPRGLGRVTHAAFGADGSGSLTIDMNDPYGAAAGRLYTLYGNFRNASEFKDLNIRATRAMAVDYSGKSGAPCLFVLVDRVRGGKNKQWTWNLGDPAVVPKVAIDGSSFTYPKGAGTLRGTFVAPSPAKIRATVFDAPGEGRGTGERKVPLVLAEGGDDFFLVATVQEAKATPPEVKADGAGLDATVRVGGQTVRFDGQKVLFSPVP